MLLCSRDGHIEQSALLLQLAHRVRTHRTGEDVFFESHHEHRRELQSLGRVDGHQRHLVVLVAIIAVEIRQQRHLLQEVGQIHLIAHILLTSALHEILQSAQELLQVLLPRDILWVASGIDILADA